LLFETNSDSEPPLGAEGLRTVRKGPHRLENFWLCDKCSSRLVARLIRGKVEVVPREDAADPSTDRHEGSRILFKEPTICELE
jgi:hypothetical protein